MRGRPREFDLDDGLERAMRVFWRHGYDGTGISDLTAAVGISRPSLYAAYGNKEALFRSCLDRYLAGPGGYVREALLEPSARAVFARLLAGVIDVTTRKEGPGCLLVQAALATSAEAGPVRSEAIARRLAWEAALGERLARAKHEGELPAGTEAADLARYISAVSYGIAIQAAGGATRTDLRKVADTAYAAWPGA